MSNDRPEHVSRGGIKLAHAVEVFRLEIRGRICADLGCSTGGFTDCLLQAGAERVYAVDRGYGVIHQWLRQDRRVILMERTDARLVHLPEPIHIVTIDCGWTRQSLVLPNARRLLAPDGRVVTLVKPQYEAQPSELEKGILPDAKRETVLSGVRDHLPSIGLTLLAETLSPIRGSGGNQEMLWLLAAK